MGLYIILCRRLESLRHAHHLLFTLVLTVTSSAVYFSGSGNTSQPQTNQSMIENIRLRFNLTTDQASARHNLRSKNAI